MKSKLNGFKKAIAVVCGVCLSTVLAGCGGANGTGTESGNEFTLKFWSSGLGSSNDSVYHVLGVRPVLNLNSELVIESGSGTESDPYRISA